MVRSKFKWQYRVEQTKREQGQVEAPTQARNQDFRTNPMAFGSHRDTDSQSSQIKLLFYGMNQSATTITKLICAILFLSTQIGFAQKEKLFNGKDLAGWSIESDGQFSVSDGQLMVNRGTGWLRSDKEYGDYTLIMKFKFMNAGANSGIFIRTGPESSTEEGGWPTVGYQVQCRDTLDGQYPLGHMIPYGAGDFQEEFFEDALKQSYKETGKWNTFKIVLEGTNLEVFLNGTLITTASDIKKESGHIGIQGEHGLLAFKKIVVKT